MIVTESEQELDSQI